MALQSKRLTLAHNNEIARADVPSMVTNPALKMELIPSLGSGNQLHMNWDPKFAPLNDYPSQKSNTICSRSKRDC